MIDVFVSYKGEEREKAQAIADALARRGYRVWWDVELLPGASFATEIASIIDQAKAAVVLWSEESVKSDFVRAEADLARKREILIPVRLDDIDVPLPFNTYHTLDLTDWNGSSSDPLLQSLVRSVEKRIPAPIESSENETVKGQSLHYVDDEAIFWREISSLQEQSADEYELYLERFGDKALFSDLARMRINRLNQTKISQSRISFKSKVATLTAILALISAALGIAIQGKEISDWLESSGISVPWVSSGDGADLSIATATELQTATMALISSAAKKFDDIRGEQSRYNSRSFDTRTQVLECKFGESIWVDNFTIRYTCGYFVDSQQEIKEVRSRLFEKLAEMREVIPAGWSVVTNENCEPYQHCFEAVGSGIEISSSIVERQDGTFDASLDVITGK